MNKSGWIDFSGIKNIKNKEFLMASMNNELLLSK